jgi:hypothetical protein
MGAIEEVAKYIVDQGLGTAIGTDVFTDYEPESPDAMITVNTIKSYPTIRVMGSTLGAPDGVHRPRFQIVIRNTNRYQARKIARQVWALFEGLGGVTLTGVTPDSVTTQATYLLVLCDQPEPEPINPDKADRHRYVINISVNKTQSTVV